MAEKRLFIGLSFQEKLATEFEPWVKKIKKTADRKEVGLKWTLPENYHVTLVFLGSTNEDAIPEIQAKMKAVASRHSPFSLKVRGLSGFPAVHQARVLYLGVQRSQAILDLQSDLEIQFKDPTSFEPDYTPHLTIARLRNPKNCHDLLSPFEKVDLGKQQVTEIVLFNSVLAGNFPVYEKLAQVPLSPDTSHSLKL